MCASGGGAIYLFIHIIISSPFVKMIVLITVVDAYSALRARVEQIICTDNSDKTTLTKENKPREKGAASPT